MIRREHVRVRHVTRLHKFDALGIRNRNEYVLTRNTKRLRKNILDISNMFEDLKDQNRIERPVVEGQIRINIDYGQAIVRRPQIFKIDIASNTFPAFIDQCGAVCAEAAAQIENRSSRMTASKTHERPIVLAGHSGNAGFIEIVSSLHY